ncbi:hypothetical protein ACFLW2_04805, partial [Chloroflexota bacterium]
MADKSQEKVAREISECQGRIVQILAPAIFGFGITAVSSVGGVSGSLDWARITIFLIAFNAVFIASGLYIGALSNKIFSNAAFLQYYSKEQGDWERLVKKYREKEKLGVMEMETTTLGLIYTILAGMVSIFLGYVV